MCEQVYMFLLRMLAPRFAAVFGSEAIQLVRDRCRNERGFLARLRLIRDLVADLTACAMRDGSYGRAKFEIHDSLIVFHQIEAGLPRAYALALGAALSVATVGAIPALVGLGGAAVYAHASMAPLYASEFGSAIGASGQLDAEERKRIVSAIAARLREGYVIPDVGSKMAEALAAHEASGDYGTVTSGSSLASLLTKQLRDVSHDGHLRVNYQSEQSVARQMSADDFRKFAERDNCAFRKAEILSDNIGYLKFDAFAPLEFCRSTIVNAMGFVQNADAIIFDLRDNRGGDPQTVAFVISYLFDKPTHLNDIYDPHERTTHQFWTLAHVPGKKLTGKPAFVLTSASTFSGAEEFTYDLKNLKRAVIVGEGTGGGAHLVRPERIDAHFVLDLPFARPINPVSHKDWEGTGVLPDIKTTSAKALDAALHIAETRLDQK